MSHLGVLLIASLAWLVWIPAALLQRRTRGDHGGVSIVPAIPLFPAVAWAAAYAFHLLDLPMALNFIGSIHLLLLIVLVLSIVKSAVAIRRLKGN